MEFLFDCVLFSISFTLTPIQAEVIAAMLVIAYIITHRR